jgi:hypothetical protein
MALRTVFLALVLFIFAQLCRAADGSQDVRALTGFTIAQLIWYLAFTEAITMSVPALGEVEVDREVRSGDIAYRLVRPLSYPLFHLATGLGERVLRFALSLFYFSKFPVVSGRDRRSTLWAVVAAGWAAAGVCGNLLRLSSRARGSGRLPLNAKSIICTSGQPDELASGDVLFACSAAPLSSSRRQRMAALRSSSSRLQSSSPSGSS